MRHLTPERRSDSPTDVASARDRRRRGAHAPGPLLRVAALLLLTVLVASAVAPSAAQADGILGTGISLPDPLHLIGSGVGSLLGPINGGIAQLAVGAFEAIIRTLFAPIARFITTQLIGWLVAVPNLTQADVAQLEQTIAAMAGGVLGAVATFSIIRYWAAGFAGGGDSGFSALEGLIRTVAAALFIATWPWLFDRAVGLTNLLTSALLRSGTEVKQTAHLLGAGLGAGIALNLTPVGLFVEIAIAVAASLLFLGLLVMKIVLASSTILLFVGMPLAAVLWPLVPWVARAAMRAFAVCLAVPVIWALCFAAAGATTLNALTLNAPTLMNTLLQPLVAIVLMWLMIRVPTHLARVAMLGAAPLGGGFVSRAVSYAAGSQLRDLTRQHLPAWAGGQTTPERPQTESPTASRLRTAATLAGAAATGGAGAATTAAAARTTGATLASGPAGAGGASSAGARNGNSASAGAGNGCAYTPPPSAQARAAGQELQSGLQTPSFAGREQDFANETFEAQYRERTSPVTAEQATAALAGLPESTRRGIGQLISDHGAGAREHLAYQALGEWSPEQRDALRTLAAATPELRAQAIDEAIGPDPGSDHVHSGPGKTPLSEEPRDSMPETPAGPGAGRTPPAPPSESPAPPSESPGSVGDAGSAPVAAPTDRRPPGPGSVPPAQGPREPRGPNPDELFPGG